MFSFENIYKAYIKCRKHKRNTHNALLFESNLLTNLWSLHHDLVTQNYKIGKSLCFLTHSPKLREVFAADFRDRIVHHLLVGELESFYEKKMIHDVYNNRVNRGIHKAVQKAQKYMNVVEDGYYLQLDIKGFFYNIDKNTLYEKILNDSCDFFYRDEILYLSKLIIFHQPTKSYIFKGDRNKLKLLPPHKTLFKLPQHIGLPIGNLTSQFFANVYMNHFDNFLKRELKVKHYIRYVDDFVLFDKDKYRLLEYKKSIESYLETELHLKLREDSKLKLNTNGLDFLGYIIRPNYILVRRRVISNFKYKKAKYLDEYEKKKGSVSLEESKIFLPIQASFASHCKHANSFKLIKKVGFIDEEKYIKLITTEWCSSCGYE